MCIGIPRKIQVLHSPSHRHPEIREVASFDKNGRRVHLVSDSSSSSVASYSSSPRRSRSRHYHYNSRYSSDYDDFDYPTSRAMIAHPAGMNGAFYSTQKMFPSTSSRPGRQPLLLEAPPVISPPPPPSMPGARGMGYGFDVVDADPRGVGMMDSGYGMGAPPPPPPPPVPMPSTMMGNSMYPGPVLPLDGYGGGLEAARIRGQMFDEGYGSGVYGGSGDGGGYGGGGGGRRVGMPRGVSMGGVRSGARYVDGGRGYY